MADVQASAALAAQHSTRFLRALFDLSFTKFITTKVARFIYVVIMVLVILAWLGAVIAAFSQNAAGAGLLVLLVGWIPALIWLALIRVALEAGVAVVSIAERVIAYARRDGVG